MAAEGSELPPSCGAGAFGVLKVSWLFPLAIPLDNARIRRRRIVCNGLVNVSALFSPVGSWTRMRALCSGAGNRRRRGCNLQDRSYGLRC